MSLKRELHERCPRCDAQVATMQPDGFRIFVNPSKCTCEKLPGRPQSPPYETTVDKVVWVPATVDGELAREWEAMLVPNEAWQGRSATAETDGNELRAALAEVERLKETVEYWKHQARERNDLYLKALEGLGSVSALAGSRRLRS